MNFSHEQRRELCKDLHTIEQAGMLERLTVVRLTMIRERRRPGAWDLVAIDSVTKRASKLVGGEREWWEDAAAAAIGFPSEAEIVAEAIREVAADARGERADDEPEPTAPQQQQQDERPASRVTVGSGPRKRGQR